MPLPMRPRWLANPQVLWIAILILGTLSAFCPAQEGDPRAERPRFDRPVLIRFEGEINLLSEQFLYRKLDEARHLGADLVIVEIDSPGGGVDETVQIADRILRSGWCHTVAYVPRQALSGGAIIALAFQELVMAPRALMGDAGPIERMIHESVFRHAPEKVRTDLIAKVRNIAEQNDRPPALAEAMIDMNLIVYEAENLHDGRKRYLSAAEIEADGGDAEWRRGDPVFESRKGVFLEVTGQRAVQLGLADATADDRDALLARYDLARRPVIMQSTWVDTLVLILNAPLVTGLLFVVGLVALYVEFSTPGISIGGLLAGLCFALFFWSRFLGGTAGWLEVVLFLAGLVFLGVELFVLPGFGVAGLTGLLLLVASLILASQNFIVPGDSLQMSKLINTLSVVVGSVVVFIAAAVAYSWMFGKVPLLHQLALEPPEPEVAFESAVAAAPGIHRSGVQDGDRGVAESALRPAGRARFGETSIDVVADGQFLTAGTPLRVIEIRGNRVVVVADRQEDSPPATV